MNRTGIVATLALVLAGAVPVYAADRKAVNSPEAGTLCDQYMCADAGGVSKSLTEKHLGKAAATKLFSQGDFDLTEFTLANGVFCDTKARSCYVDRYFNADGTRSAAAPHETSILFGK